MNNLTWILAAFLIGCVFAVCAPAATPAQNGRFRGVNRTGVLRGLFRGSTQNPIRPRAQAKPSQRWTEEALERNFGKSILVKSDS